MAESPSSRFVALDVHKAYFMVGALDAQQTIVLPPRKVPMTQAADWFAQHLQPTDQVVLESSSSAWYLVDLLQPLVARVVVANPLRLKQIAAASVKTDKRDTLALARLLVADLIPEVWIPPHPVRELRALIAHRHRLVKQRTMAINRLHAIVIRFNLAPPPGRLWIDARQDWWDQQELPASERLRLRQDQATIQHLTDQIAEVEQELAHLSAQEPWADQVPFLIQLPGIGLVTAMTILSAIGDITRFPTAKKLVGYSGLGSRIRASGQTHRSGGITHEGRKELRAVLVEAVLAAAQRPSVWRERLERLRARIGSGKATVALARKLLVVIWHVLTRRVADQHADVEAVARRFTSWGTRYRDAPRQGRSRAAFVRDQLDTVGLGADLETVQYGGKTLDIRASAMAPG
jgi:transposase